MKKNNLFYIIFIIFFLLHFLLFINICLADCICNGNVSPNKSYDDCQLDAPYCHWEGAVPSTSNGTVQLKNPLTGDTTASNIPTLLGKAINAVLGIVGSLALVMIVFGGFTWMTAAGNADKVKKGKDILVWAAIGLAVIFSAYALVRFVFTGLGAP